MNHTLGFWKAGGWMWEQVGGMISATQVHNPSYILSSNYTEGFCFVFRPEKGLSIYGLDLSFNWLHRVSISDFYLSLKWRIIQIYGNKGSKIRFLNSFVWIALLSSEIKIECLNVEPFSYWLLDFGQEDFAIRIQKDRRHFQNCPSSYFLFSLFTLCFTATHLLGQRAQFPHNRN